MWQIVPDAARDDAVRIAAREFADIGTGLRVRCAIGIAFQGNRRHGDDRTFGEPLFQLVILWLAFGQPEPPTVIVDHDADMIRVVEGRGAAREGGLVEVPFRRRELPDEPGKVALVSLVAGPAALGGEVILLPPLVLRRWRQRHLAGCLAADQVPTHRDERLAALRPEHSHDVRGTRSPIEAGDNCLVDVKRIH